MLTGIFVFYEDSCAVAKTIVIIDTVFTCLHIFPPYDILIALFARRRPFGLGAKISFSLHSIGLQPLE